MQRGTLLLKLLLKLLLALFLALGFAGCRHANKVTAATTTSQNLAAVTLASNPTKPDFDTQIKPIFQTRCQPCHFPGGKVYDKMPFDKPETITRLGEKLFTRVKDENERRLIREFLAP